MIVEDRSRPRIPVRLVVGLVMWFDHLVAGVPGRGVDAEHLDAEMATDEMELAAVDVRVRGVDLGQGIHVDPADDAVRCGARIADAADTRTLALTRRSNWGINLGDDGMSAAS